MTHILVVEDEDHLAKGIQFNLQAEGYQVTVASEGPEGLSGWGYGRRSDTALPCPHSYQTRTTRCCR